MAEPIMRVGMDVYYYHAGDTTKKPYPAKIMAINGAGALDLTVIGSGSFARRENVYHRDSPELVKRPLVKNSQGCWEHVEYLPRFNESGEMYWPEKAPVEPPAKPAELEKGKKKDAA